jgi:chromosome segregation ATPase
MNKDRRKAISNLISRIEEISATLYDLGSEIEQLQSEEQDYYDNMPESLQGGERGERAQEAADALQEAYDAVDNLDIDEITSALDRACE